MKFIMKAVWYHYIISWQKTSKSLIFIVVPYEEQFQKLKKQTLKEISLEPSFVMEKDSNKNNSNNK